jgi:hypothetical protein
MRIAFITVLSLSLSFNVIADSPQNDIDAGEKAYANKDYKTAFELAKKQADLGNAEAQNNLGLMYVEGKGVQQDYKEAEKWWLKAAEQGFTSAQYNLGLLYGDDHRGIQQSDTEAAKWFLKAAEQGDISAQYNLGHMYNKGQGVPQNNVLAYMWWHLSTIQGNDDARKNRDYWAKELTEKQLEEAQRLARERKPTSMATSKNRPSIKQKSAYDQIGATVYSPNEIGWSLVQKTNTGVSFCKQFDTAQDTACANTVTFRVDGFESDAEFLNHIKEQREKQDDKKRFVRLTVNNEQVSFKNTSCLKYKSLSEDHKDSGVNSKNFQYFKTSGYICRHPANKDIAFQMEMSHRSNDKEFPVGLLPVGEQFFSNIKLRDNGLK